LSGRDERCWCGGLVRGRVPAHREVKQKAGRPADDVTGDDFEVWAAADGRPMGTLIHATPRRGFIAGALAGLALPFIRTRRVAAGAVGMTDEQARVIQAICNGADGECISCAEELRDALIEAFPEHANAFREVHAERYGNWWRDEQ
jgi:hypothetical protein